MAAEPHRSNQPLVNGQSENGSSKGNSDRNTVDGEKDTYHPPQYTQAAHAPVGPPLHLNWPRQQRPPDPRGLNPQTGARPPPHQGVRRVSPWSVLRNKLPDQQGVRPPGLEHAIYRMQNPEDMMRPRGSPDINGYSRPPMGMSRPSSGQLSKPPSFEGATPPGSTPPRSPFLQRTDSRTGMFPGMMTPPPGGIPPRPPSLSPRPPIVNRLSREEDDDDTPSSPGPVGSRPGSATRFPTPPLVRTPSGPSGGVVPMPGRPPSRTPPPPTQSPQPGIPGAASPIPPRTTPPRQSSVTSISGQSDQSLKPDNLSETESVKSSTPSPRPLSAATSQESDNPPPSTDMKPLVKETKPEPAPVGDQLRGSSATSEKPNENSPPKESPTTDSSIKGDETPKRPTFLETSKREGNEVLSETPSDSKDAPTSSEGSKETVVNGSHDSPKKLPPKGSAPKKLGAVPAAAKSPSKSLPKTPDTPGTSEKKKLPMNKIQVGAAPSPNLKVIKSKIGSLENAKHKPGGGHVKIESRKLDFKSGPRIEAKNDTYSPGGGEKKIQQVKLQWNAKSKIGSLENATHKPGGGDKKIESIKLDFKDKAKPKVGSKDNLKHTPGGGQVKIEDQKLDIKAQSRVGSMDNVKHKPGGGEIKIFDDKEYMKNVMGSTSDVHSASNQVRRTSRSSSSSRTRLSGSKSGTRENLTDDLYSPEKPPSKPLAKPTDQNSNQLSRAHNDSADKDETKAEPDKKNEVTNAIDDKKPPPTPKTNGAAALASDAGEPPSSQHKEAVIEKSQTEMPEKELTKP